MLPADRYPVSPTGADSAREPARIQRIAPAKAGALAACTLAAGGTEACGRAEARWSACYASVCGRDACGSDVAVAACVETDAADRACAPFDPITKDCGGASNYASLEKTCKTFVDVARVLCGS